LCKDERYILLSGVNVATGFLLMYSVNILTGHLGSPERVLFGIKIIMGDLRKKQQICWRLLQKCVVLLQVIL
jgi:hypothetical protein